MMRGVVSNLQALVTIQFVVPDKGSLSIEFVIDTGFTGYLCVPLDLLKQFCIVSCGDMRVQLADDSWVVLDLYPARILWHGVEMQIDAIATGSRPLIGTALLDGSRMNTEFRENGPVSLFPL